MVLTCSQVALSMWKAKYLSDTKDPGLSSEDEAAGLLPHRSVARRLPVSHGSAPYHTPFHLQEAIPQPSAPAAAAGVPQGGVTDVGGDSDVVPGPAAPPVNLGNCVVAFPLLVVASLLIFVSIISCLDSHNFLDFYLVSFLFVLHVLQLA